MTPIGCSVSFNALTDIITFNTTPPSNVALGYNALASFSTCSAGFNALSNGIISSTITGNFQISSPSIAQAKTYNAINGNLPVTVNNVTIFNPANVSISKSFDPSASLQSFSSNPIPGVFFSAVANAIAQVRGSVTLGYNGTYASNSTCLTHVCNVVVNAPAYPNSASVLSAVLSGNLLGDTVNVLIGGNQINYHGLLINSPSMPFCTLNNTLTPSIGLVTQFSNLTPPCRVVLMINSTQKANIYNSLLPGQGVSNTILGIAVNAIPVNQIIFSFPDLQLLYQQRYGQDCNHLYIPHGAAYGICLDNLSSLMSGDILAAKNISEGAGKALRDANQYYSYQTSTCYQSYNGLNTTYQAVKAFNDTNTKLVAKLVAGDEAQGWQAGGGIGVLVVVVAGYVYLRRRSRNERVVWGLGGKR